MDIASITAAAMFYQSFGTVPRIFFDLIVILSELDIDLCLSIFFLLNKLTFVINPSYFFMNIASPPLSHVPYVDRSDLVMVGNV